MLTSLYFCALLFYDKWTRHKQGVFQMIDKVMGNRAAMIVISISLAVGAVVSIAAGFLVTYKIITYVGT
jgi:hypothetical protein